jgi:hypothetical protein
MWVKWRAIETERLETVAAAAKHSFGGNDAPEPPTVREFYTKFLVVHWMRASRRATPDLVFAHEDELETMFTLIDGVERPANGGTMAQTGKAAPFVPVDFESVAQHGLVDNADYLAYASQTRPGLCTQVRACIVRSFTQLYRGMSVLVTDAVLVSFAGCVLAIVYKDKKIRPLLNGDLTGVYGAIGKIQAANFILSLSRCASVLMLYVISRFRLRDARTSRSSATFISTVVALTACQSGLRTFGLSKDLMRRERRAGVSPVAYFIGKIAASVVPCVLMPFLFSVFYVALSSPQASTFAYFGVLLVHYIAFRAVGYIVSLLMSAKQAQLAGVVLVLIMHMISGSNPTLIKLEKMNVRWLSDMMPSRYTWVVPSAHVTLVLLCAAR